MEKDMRTKCQRPFSKTKMQTLRVRDSSRVKGKNNTGEKNKEREKNSLLFAVKAKKKKKKSSCLVVGRTVIAKKCAL
jgi:hypothetical protein